MALRKPPGWRKIVDKGGVIPLFKKVIAKMDAQEIAKYEKLVKDFLALEKETSKAWQKGHAYATKIQNALRLKLKLPHFRIKTVGREYESRVPLTQQKKLDELYKSAEMTGRRAVRAYDRYNEFYKKMMKKYG